MPALVKAYRMQEKAAQVGFDWENKAQVWEKVEEELLEFKEAVSDEEKENELGDLLFSLVNYARFSHINPDDALEKTNRKFIKRFNYIEDKAASLGLGVKHHHVVALARQRVGAGQAGDRIAPRGGEHHGREDPRGHLRDLIVGHHKRRRNLHRTLTRSATRNTMLTKRLHKRQRLRRINQLHRSNRTEPTTNLRHPRMLRQRLQMRMQRRLQTLRLREQILTLENVQVRHRRRSSSDYVPRPYACSYSP